MNKNKWYQDLVLGLILFLFSLSIFFALPLFVADTSQSLGADFFPRFLLILLMVLSLFLIVNPMLLKKTKEKTSGEKEDETEDEGKRRVIVGWAVFGILIVYTFVVENLGFVATSIIFMSLIMYILSARKWYYYLILICMIFLINYVFKDLMKIMLP